MLCLARNNLAGCLAPGPNKRVSVRVILCKQRVGDIFNHNLTGQWGSWHSAKFQSIVLID
jgi:hypothetical protein